MNTAHHTVQTLRRSAAVAALCGLAIAACGSDDDTTDDEPAAEDTPGEATVEIDDPWSREPVEGQTTSAVYGVLTNNGDDTLTAVAASTSVTDDVELHEVVMNDEGQMSMRERDGGYEIAPGESVTLEPGDFHIMLLDIDPATYPDTVDVTLEFDDGSSLDFTADVRPVDGAMGDMDMDEMDHGGDGEMDMDEMDDSGDGEMDDG